MNFREVIPLIDDGGEHKFLVSVRQSPVYIVHKPLTELTKLVMLTHEGLVNKMRGDGIFGEEEVLGGYCIVRRSVLRYWGESSTPVRAATQEQFEDAIKKRDILLISMRGKVG